MNEFDEKQIAEKISKDIEFPLHPDQEHILANAVGNYFNNLKLVDEAPRPGKLIKEIEKLRNASSALSYQISNLHSTTTATIASFRSFYDDRDVKQILGSLADNSSWISEKTERVLRLLEERKPTDKGGPKMHYARRILVHHLIWIYESATGKPAAYGTDEKSGERKIRPLRKICSDLS